MENYISLINEWCQKNKYPFPTYDFIGDVYNWKCKIVLNDLEPVISDVHMIKRDAKIEAAQKFYTANIINTKTKSLNLKDPAIFLIDGDQRSDCWKFFADDNIKWSSDIDVLVFVNSMTKVLPTSNPIQIKTSKSQSKDCVDLDILISIGIILGQKIKKKMIVISSDHILSQAAKDYDLGWIPNLDKLKEYLNL